MSKKRAALYLRVSTEGQTTDNQRIVLEEVALRNGWDIVDIYKDQAISGAKGRSERPEFDRLCKDATKRKFDVIMAWSVDRLGRSLQDLVNFLEELNVLKVDLFLHQQGVDTTTPGGKALFQMMGVFAEFERTLIKERVVAGIARAKAEGKPHGRPGLSEEKKSEIRAAKEAGLSVRKISAQTGVSVGAVQKVLNPQDKEIIA